MTELLVIADDSDELAFRLAEQAAASGRIIELCRYAEGARRLAIARRGDVVSVTPGRPMFLRLPAPLGPWARPEAQFHHAEMCSLIWAAAALSTAPVVNRPNAFGMAGRCSSSSTVLRSRVARETCGVEVFASDAPEEAPADEWWVESQVKRVAQPWTSPHIDAGPYRFAQVRPGFQLHLITVVGERAFARPGSPSDDDIANAAVQICHALGLLFAVVTLRSDPDANAAVLIRVSPHPLLAEIGDRWDQVADHLLSELAA